MTNFDPNQFNLATLTQRGEAEQSDRERDIGKRTNRFDLWVVVVAAIVVGMPVVAITWRLAS